MIKIEKAETYGWMAAVRGMRNPKNSWAKSDTGWTNDMNLKATKDWCNYDPNSGYVLIIGENDEDLMKRLVRGGPEHAKFLRMIMVTADITAPDYWWKEYATYKVGTVENSTSTMHKITSRELTESDFSLDNMDEVSHSFVTTSILPALEKCRKDFLATGDKLYWRSIIKMLPMSYNYKRTVCLNYAVLANMYHQRRHHKLDEWLKFCDWVESLPYSYLITKSFIEDERKDGEK